MTYFKQATFMALTIGLVAVAMQTHGTLAKDYGIERHANKAHETFLSFFPFYLTEHEDPMCKLMHVFGTCIASLFMLFNPNLILALVSSTAIGFIVSELTSNAANGGIEALVIVTSYFALNRIISKRFFWEPILIGYAFAWIGHFYYEHNRPATFIYPAYSLASDYYMLGQIAIGKIDLPIPGK